MNTHYTVYWYCILNLKKDQIHMNIFFGCTTHDLELHKEVYLAIRKHILDSGHILTRDWIPEAIDEANSNIPQTRRPDLYDEVMNAILHSDLTIFECSAPGMSVGHQITFSIEKSKPTLILLDSSGKNTGDLFIAGTNSPYLRLKNYKNPAELDKIIDDFLSNNSPTSKTRFNLVIERELNNYVEWASFKKNLSKTEIIKNAINNKMKYDEEYQKYINTNKN